MNRPFIHCSDYAKTKGNWYGYVSLVVKTNRYIKKYGVYNHKRLKKIIVIIPNKHFKMDIATRLYIFPAIQKLLKGYL